MDLRVIVPVLLAVLASSPVSAYDLGQHQWQHRLLFLVAPADGDPDLAAQRRSLEQRQDAVRDRDIRLFRLFPDHGFVDDRALAPESVRQLRRELGVGADDRTVILVGKDGGVKRRGNLFVVTKAWSTELGYDRVLQAFDGSQRRLDLEGFALSGEEISRINDLDAGRRFNVDTEAAIEANMKMTVPE
jgi:hypothetical protein